MPLTPDRRTFCLSALAGLSFRPAFAARYLDLDVLLRWQTGNRRLNPLAVANGVLFFSGDTTVGAYALGTRAPLWEHPHGFKGPATFRPRLVGGLDGGTDGGLSVCGGSTWIAAYRIADGAEVWRRPAEIDIGVPLATPDTTYYGDGHFLIAVETVTGREKWRFAAYPGTLANYAAARNATTVFFAPGDGKLYALGREDGVLRWAVDGAEPWQYLRQIYMHQGRLVAGTYHEDLIGIDPNSGETLWSYYSGNFINSELVADGTAFFWSPTGWIYAINTETGHRRWRYRTTDYDESESNWGPVLAELVVFGDYLYVLDMKNDLHRIDIRTGEHHEAAHVPARIRHALLPVAGLGIAFPTEKGEILLTPFI